MLTQGRRLACAVACVLVAGCAPTSVPAAGPQPGSSATILEGLPRAQSVADPYRRAAFGAAWADTDGNGCNQRDDVLYRDADPGQLLTVKVKGSCDHDVVAGTWVDPYSGRSMVFTNLLDPKQAQQLQIDHTVSLSDAWATGASTWTADERLAFATDLSNLRAVDGAQNMAKADAGPTRWLPAINRCAFVTRYLSTKARYHLGVTDKDRGQLRILIRDCP